MQVADISFEWSGEHFDIPGRGLVYMARLTGETRRGELGKLIGKTVENPDGIYCRIRDVPSAVISDDQVILNIGLLLEPLERPF